MLDGQHIAHTIDFVDIQEELRVHLSEGNRAVLAHILGGICDIEQDVDGAVSLRRKAGHRLYGRFIAQVYETGDCLSTCGTNLFRHSLGFVRSKIRHYNFAALFPHSVAGRRAVSACASHDQSDFIL